MSMPGGQTCTHIVQLTLSPKPRLLASDPRALEPRGSPSAATLLEDHAEAHGIKVKKYLFPWTASGDAIVNGRDEGYGARS